MLGNDRVQISGFVLARIARAGNEFVDRPKIDLHSCKSGPTVNPKPSFCLTIT
jgi:hypothetical protein